MWYLMKLSTHMHLDSLYLNMSRIPINIMRPWIKCQKVGRDYILILDEYLCGSGVYFGVIWHGEAQYDDASIVT